ncbi:hypothetical protein [Streptomyces abyssomicinicus]|uniref:hypothetical protein n=1 Tax=Streptomyces abyssomicinicus TaxID=574929 RepID=UPI00124FE9DA|nr:hypothetical protein [Streptomyces abyssomicinicus]
MDDDDITSCRLCGEFVLQIPGATGIVHSYWLLRATWNPDHQFFHGPLHFSCLAQWKHREPFRKELAGILTGRGRTLTLEVEGIEHTLEQPGFSYSERLHQDADCAIYRNTATDRWLVLTAQASWITLGPQQVRALGQGAPARVEGGVDRVALLEDPGPNIQSATLPELLDLLGSRERYPGVLENGSPDYQFWEYHPRKRVLEYSVKIDLPLPVSAVEFFTEYAHSYEPISFENLE